jgi:hypothetical protein
LQLKYYSKLPQMLMLSCETLQDSASIIEHGTQQHLGMALFDSGIDVLLVQGQQAFLEQRPTHLFAA